MLRPRAAQARAEIETLEAQLAAAKAKLRAAGKGEAPAPVKAAPSTQDTARYGCPDCDKMFDSPQGRGAHRNKAHGFRRHAS